jgi:hypothetical protein
MYFSYPGMYCPLTPTKVSLSLSHYISTYTSSYLLSMLPTAHMYLDPRAGQLSGRPEAFLYFLYMFTQCINASKKNQVDIFLKFLYKYKKYTLIYMYKNLSTWDTDLYKFYTARINAYKICKYIYTSFGRRPLLLLK